MVTKYGWGLRKHNMYVTDAIILKKEPIGEADLLVTALTPRFTRIRLVAQAARKADAKLKGHLEALSLSRLYFVAGRTNYRLVGAELTNFFLVIKGELGRFAVAREFVQMLDSALFEDRGGDTGDFFSFTKEALLFLDGPSTTPAEYEGAFIWFRIQFLSALGLLPEESVEGIWLPENMNELRRVPCSDFVKKSPELPLSKLKEATSHLLFAYLPR